MVELIEEIINKFGGRQAGSPEEARAQKFIFSRWEKLFDKVVLDEFEDHLRAKFGSLKWFCVIFYISLALYWLSPLLSMCIAIPNGLLFLKYFVLYSNLLDPLFKKRISWNVHGTIEPEGEVKQQVIVAGHMDSTPEFPHFYYFKKFGIYLNVIGGFSMLLYGFAILPIAISDPFSFHMAEHYFNPNFIWFFFALLAPTTLSYYFIHGKIVVDGAIDNLSGLAVADAVGKHFAELKSKGNLLKHTRLKLISFGAEETGLKGSRAFVAKYLSELQEPKSLLINLDTIRAEEYLLMLNEEVNPGVKYPRNQMEALKETAAECNVSFNEEKLWVGGTDAASFARAGLDAISIIGIPSDSLDPTYHTRLDKVENLNPDGIEALKKVIIKHIEKTDQLL